MYFEFKKSIKNVVYWCDTSGQLHHDADYDLRSPKELPIELQVAFGNIWLTGTYLIEFNGRYSVAIEASYDEDLVHSWSLSYEELKEVVRRKAKKYAEKYPELDIIFGDDTTEWNDGSTETVILFLCPWNMEREKV